MSFGIHLYDSNGRTVVDESFSVAELVESGSRLVTSINPNSSVQYTTIYFSRTYPSTGLWLALYLNIGFYAGFAGWQYDAAGNIVGCALRQWNPALATKTLNYRLYRVIDSTTPLDTHGVAVYRSNGRIAFDSGRKYAYVAGFVSPNVPALNSLQPGSAYTSHPYAPSGWYLVSNYDGGGVEYNTGCGGYFFGSTPFFFALVYRMYNSTTFETTWRNTACVPATATGLPQVATAGGVFPLVEVL